MVQRRNRQFATPLYLSSLDVSGTAQTLEAGPLAGTGDADLQHDEGWLQRLIFNFPHTLPVRDIDPGFGSLVAVCIELRVGSGSLDSLFVTDSGDLVIMECKLWRNPQARREVVAQIIDYAHSLASWTYEDLDRAISQATSADGQKVSQSLFAHISERTDLTEQQFVDAVSRNLRLGRMLLLIVGDGIREGAETLTEYLQLHAGFHFTLALVEMPVYRLPVGGFVIQPRILARTVNIERGIVHVSDGMARIKPQAPPPLETRVVARAVGLTEDRLRETIKSNIPGAIDALDKFSVLGSDHGVFVESSSKSIMVKWRGPDEDSYSLGGIHQSGDFISYPVNWGANGLGCIDLAHDYLASLAVLVDGVVRKTPNPNNWYVAKIGTQLPNALDVLTKPEAWLTIIDAYTSKLTSAIFARQS